MNDKEQAIHAELNLFREKLKALGVPTYAICISFDDTPDTGGGLTKVYGDADTVAQMCCTIAANLPAPFFIKMLTHLAMNPVYAANRGEDIDLAILGSQVN